MGDRGVAAIELALVGPVLAVALMAAVELSAQATVAAALDFGARSASRTGITGGVDGTGSVASDQLRIEAVRAAVIKGGGDFLLDPAKLTLTPASYNTTADAANKVNGTNGPGSAGQLVRYKLSYAQPLLVTYFGFEFPTPTYTSTVLVKNEPFPSK